MKPTQVAELFANIKKTFVSFFSILMFAALGVGIFLGISWVAPAMHAAADKVFDEGSFHDIQIQFPYGLTDDDLTQLADIEGVSDIEAGYQSFQEIEVTGTNWVVKVQTQGERIDALTVVEGELPTKTDEIALGAYAAEEHGIGVGDLITFVPDMAESDGLSISTAPSDLSGGGEDATTDNDGMKYLNGSTYRVTALVDSPEYLAVSSATYGFSPSISGTVDLLAWVVPAAFDASAFQDGFPIVNVRCDGLRGMNTFSDDYRTKSKDVETRISELGNGLATARYDDLHDRVQDKVDEGEEKLEEGKRTIADGETQLAQGRALLETERAEGEAKLASAYDQLIEYESLLNEGEAQLEDARKRIAEGAAALEQIDAAKNAVNAILMEYQKRGDAARAAYEASEKTEKDKRKYDETLDALGKELTALLIPYSELLPPEFQVITHENYFKVLNLLFQALDAFEELPITFEGETMTIREARVKLADAERQLADGEAKIASLKAQLNDGWAAYNAGKAELAAKVADAERQLAEGEAQLEAAREQVAQYEPQLENAKKQLAAMSKYAWTVSGRASNVGVAEVSVFSDVTTNLSFSMAALFVIVGLLVSYSAVSRIVHEQITQIGTKKALGLREREITLSFLLYSALAVVTGALVGTAMGFTLVEGIISKALSSMFIFGTYPPYFGLALFLVVTVLELLLVLGTTWFACHSILREHAVELLKGEQPPDAKTRFYEKWAVWDRLPLLTQTIVNNCVNDKRRVFSTVVGVAGCTALIVTALTLNNDVLKSYDVHYTDVYGFTTIAYVDNSVDKALDTVERVFQDEGAATAQILRKDFIMKQSDGSAAAMRVIVPADADDFAQVYHVNPVLGSELDQSAEGVWVSHALAEHFGVKVGDEVELDAGDGVTHRLPILGFYEFWLTYHELVMGKDYYEREFGEKPVSNVVLSNVDELTAEIEASLGGVDGFYSVSDDKKFQHKNFEMFSSVSSAVVLIYLILSALMAVVVLLNLNVMFIEEKKRDLIVLMINGFSVKDAKRYIYNDSIVLTTIGIVLGIVLGCIMGSITVGAIEPTTATFVKNVDLIAVGVGIVGSSMLALIMSLISLRRIPRFDLTDINKF